MKWAQSAPYIIIIWRIGREEIANEARPQNPTILLMIKISNNLEALETPSKLFWMVKYLCLLV